MALKHQDPPQLSSLCYIERIPPEIANLICYSIDEEDALNLRLVCKFWNDVATPFMASMPGRVNLIFKPDSFQRLVDIPRHPVIGKQITSLYYEPELLVKYATQEDWEDDLPYFPRREEEPPSDASERSHRLYNRNAARDRVSPVRKYSRSHLGKAYKEYTRMYAEQEDLRNRGHGFKELADAMSRLPKLSDICMNHGGAICEGPKGVNNAFAAGLSKMRGCHCVGGGIPFMRSLVLAVHEAGIELDTLRLGHVDWKFLQQTDETLKRMKCTLRHLTTLELAISTSPEDMCAEIPVCRNYLLNNSTLSEFFAAAPKLKDLAITFDGYKPYCPAALNQIVGDTVWPYLESIAMDNIDAMFSDWNHFFKRHASTLKHLTMRTIILRDGTWIDALEKMSQVLNLKSVYAEGHLIGKNPSQDWYLSAYVDTRFRRRPTQEYLTSKAVQDYLVEGGSCPLRDEVAHPQYQS